MDAQRLCSRLILLIIFWMSFTAEAAKPVVVVGVGFTDQINVNHKGSSYHFDVLFTYRLFTELGYQVHFVIAPYAKLTQLLQQHQIDVATRQSGEAIKELLYSPVYLDVHNLVFAHKTFAAEIRQIQDLRFYHLIAFQNASHVLGQDFKRATQQAKSYQEIFDHLQAIQLLMKGRTELLIMNRKTFYRRLAELNHSVNEVKSFDILPKVNYRLAVTNPKLHDQVTKKLQSYLQQDLLKSIELEAIQQTAEVEKLLRLHQNIN
jgi:polar amino acid transport system substrate-binding protein